MMTAKQFAAAVMVFGLGVAAQGQTALKYQKPPAPIEQLLEAPPTPVVRLSPDRKTMLIEQPATFPTIADVAQPRYRLAGIRFNPSANGPSVERYDVALMLQPVDGTKPTAPKTITGLPAKLKAVDAIWAPDSKHAAFVAHATAPATGLELWVIDVATAHAHRVGTFKLNAVLGSPCAWMPDSASLLCKIVSPTRGLPPKVSDIPEGPDVEESLGKVSPAPTYEDMLKTTTDENIFEYYASADLALVSLAGVVKPLPAKGLIERAVPSPDGKYALVAIVHRPFSYTFPYQRFPLKTEIVPVVSGKAGGAVKVLSDRPAVDNLPISRDAVEAGPRDYSWRADVPATVVWVQAADGGLPNLKNKVWDQLMALPAPFDGAPAKMLDLPMRVARGGGGPGGGGVGGPVQWGNEHLAIVSVARNSDRKTMLLAFDPATGKTTTLFSGSSQDRYHNPGRPLMELGPNGRTVLKLTPDGRGIYFTSPGASPKGDQPFIAIMPVGGGEEKILFRSADPYFDEPTALLSDETVLIRRESQTMAPNYFSASLSKSAEPVQLTHFKGRYDNIKMPTRQFLKYKRADGVDLTATLWLPAGYDKSQGPLPTLMEAYPAEFTSRATASQVSGSPNRYPVFGGGSHLYLVQAGYAILDSATIPIIGEGGKEPNDTYVEQLVAGAKAAIDEGVSLGVVDPKRVAVMGHSYGAFMTANLLAHTDIFRAGIAESGAYNRSLTPYGFQNEERTYWQDPKLYYEMSPFSFADKIKTPILLIHGEADDNTGTYPIQSERFYAALKGQGATVRLVFLPLEPHAYGALETKQHVLWEINRWMETYVKPEVSPVAKGKE
jgi:dipeptidyl aminopeptidase/acylaminoacyl peptidase